MIEQSARVLKALGEPTRLKIIRFLSERELCICELVAILDMSQPRVSQHVKVLKHAGLVKERRFRQNSYISLNPAELHGNMIASFQTFMQTDIGEIPDLKDEDMRFLNLDKNQEVLSCKTGQPMPTAIKIPRIV